MTRTPSTRGEAIGRGKGAPAETLVLFGVSFEEDGVHYGVCLSHFMMAMAGTAEELDSAIVAMVDAHIEASLKLGNPPFVHLPAAPSEYWDIWLRLTKEGVHLKTLQPPPGRERPIVQLAQQAPRAA